MALAGLLPRFQRHPCRMPTMPAFVSSYATVALPPAVTTAVDEFTAWTSTVPTTQLAAGVAASVALLVVPICACVCRCRRRNEAASRAADALDEVRGFQQSLDDTQATLASLDDLQEQARQQLNTLRREGLAGGRGGARSSALGARQQPRSGTGGRSMY